MKTLEIIIPTFQRVSHLIETLEYLCCEIRSIKNGMQPSILVSDNGSTDGSAERLLEFKACNPDISIRLILKSQNEGMEENFATIFEKAEADFVVCCSDDDKLAEGYLAYLVHEMQNDEHLGVVIPGMTHVMSDGTEVGPTRTFPFDIKTLDAGERSARYIAHFCNQMTGLAFRNDRFLVGNYLCSKWRNVYPFVYFGAANSIKRNSRLAIKFPTRVLHDNKKEWNYPKDGYTDMILKNFRILNTSYNQRVRFEIEFLAYQTFRFKGLQELQLLDKLQVVFGMKSPTFLTKLYILYKTFGMRDQQ